MAAQLREKTARFPRPGHLLDLIKDFAVLREDLKWGYQLPYAITGYYNLHPRAGIERMRSEHPHEVLDLYERFANRFAPWYEKNGQMKKKNKRGA